LRDAMIEEFTTLQVNNTWDLVPVFWHKIHPDGSHDRCKARWVL
jgi:hypothetical protein